MRIAAAQTRPAKGDIARNIDRHRRFVDIAISQGAEMVFFPELSLTGYEPMLAQQLAMSEDDARFDTFQRASDAGPITIGVGVPTKRATAGVCISMVLFQPGLARRLYSKQFLHPDEEKFFVGGCGNGDLFGKRANVALAICYELSIPAHAQRAFDSGAQVYIASVAKTSSGVDHAFKRLAQIATDYSMSVLMANCLGVCDGQLCAGNTAAWNQQGALIGQLGDLQEGLLLVDTESPAGVVKSIVVDEVPPR
jgi:predicted amidohydrolase